jgi:hypothetical protein
MPVTYRWYVGHASCQCCYKITITVTLKSDQTLTDIFSAEGQSLCSGKHHLIKVKRRNLKSGKIFKALILKR